MSRPAACSRRESWRRWIIVRLDRIHLARWLTPWRLLVHHPRRVIALEPATEPIEPGEQHALGDVRLIELVANLPLQFRRDDDALRQRLVRRNPFVHLHARAAHQR